MSKTLFPNDGPDEIPDSSMSRARKLARSSDPSTSKEAAAHIAPKLGKLQESVLLMIAALPGLTVKETADAFGMEERQIGRRVSELLKMGKIKVSGSRECEITGRKARTFKVSP